MKISLFQGIFLGVCGLAAVIGIFVFATYSGDSSGGDTIGTVVIWGTLPKKDMQDVLVEMGKIDQSFKNVSYVQKNPDTLPNDLSAAIAVGTSPDLVLSSQEELLSLKKFIAPISTDTLSEAVFSSAFISEGELLAGQNSYYGIPFLVDPIVLFSNRTILSSDGIAKPPQTWEALTGLVPSVSVASPVRGIVRGLIALGTYDNVHNARGILSTLFIQSNVKISGYAAGGNISANLGAGGATGVPPGNAVVNFYTQFADPTKVSYTWNASLPDSQQAFLAGDLALYLGLTSEARYLASANPNLDFGVSPVPQPATAKSKGVYGLLYSFMIPTGAKNPSGAYQIAALFSSSDGQAAAATVTGLAPASLNQITRVPSDPIAAVAYAEALYAKGWLSPMPTDTDAVFSSMIGSVVSGRSSVANALVSAKLSLDSLLQK